MFVIQKLQSIFKNLSEHFVVLLFAIPRRGLPLM
jgi:hypothetical protein